MTKTIHFTLAFVAAFSLILLVQGCGGGTCGTDCGHDHGTTSTSPTGHDGCDGDHTPKYNETLVIFPGHKYAMEIIDEKETTGLVTAFLTDAHFDPVAVDATEVRLNFVIDGAPKQFILTRTEQEEGKPATFTLVSMELATLNCEGWEGDATARIEIGGVPFNAKMVKIGECDHDH